MIEKNLERTAENIKNMLDENDYNLLRQNAPLMISEITKAEENKLEPFTKKVDDLIILFNKILPNFLDVFVNQTNDCFIEKLEDNNNEKMLPVLKESEFYTHILDRHFERFLNAFETIHPLKWIVRSSYGNEIQVFDLQYFNILKMYLYKIMRSQNFADFSVHSRDVFTEKTWIFTKCYEHLTDNDISEEQRKSLHNWWKEYTEEHDKFMARFDKTKKNKEN